MTKPFDATLATITRKRFSTTQGEVLVEYDGVRIEQYGDAIKLDESGEYHGCDDAFWIDVARREAIARGLATNPTPPASSVALMAREPVACLGLAERIKREVYNAAVTPRDAEGRDERLTYWHRRAAAVERMAAYHGLFRPYYMRPRGKLTKVERAMVREDATAPRWRPCSSELAAGC